MLIIREYQQKIFLFFTLSMVCIAFLVMISGYIMSKNSTVQKMERSALQEIILKKEILRSLIGHAAISLRLAQRPNIIELLYQSNNKTPCLSEFFHISAAHNQNDLLQLRYIDIQNKKVLHVKKNEESQMLVTHSSDQDFTKELKAFETFVMQDTKKMDISFVILEEEKIDSFSQQSFIRIATSLWDETKILGILAIDLDMTNALKTLIASEMFDIVLMDQESRIIQSSLVRLPQWTQAIEPKNTDKTLLKLFTKAALQQGIFWDEGYVYVSDILLSEGTTKITTVLRSKNNLSEITQGITKIFGVVFVVIIGVSLFLSFLMTKFHTALLKKIITREDLLLQEGKLLEIGGMISYLAHQWKQPINRIASGIACAKGQLMHEQKPDIKLLLEDLDTSERELEEMAEHIDTFRTFYRFSQTKEPFEIEKALHHITQMLSYALHMGKITLHVKILPQGLELYGFKNEWKHAVLSILNNAIEAFHNPSKRDNQDIWIDVTATQSDILVNIHDNAGGIKPSIQKHLFEKYTSTKRKEGSTGLGLYFARMIIEERFHGNITVSSNDAGSHFSLRFPLS